MGMTNRLRNLTANGQHRSEGGVSLLAAWHNGLFCLFLVGVLAYGILFASYLLSRFDLINLIRDVSNDDAFYYFQIARNMAAGLFSTFDGGITRTNGYHPFWMLLITPFYWFNDPVGALFYIEGLEILLIAGAAALIVVAARLARLSWWLLFALLPQLYKQTDLFRGMEAAALLFMLGLFLLALVLYAGNLGCWRRSGLLAAVWAAGGGGLCPALGKAGVYRHISGGYGRFGGVGSLAGGTRRWHPGEKRRVLPADPDGNRASTRSDSRHLGLFLL